eukprot:COSAG05_NODE_137_length_16843_cov_121.090779_15_plen_76_part_00
MVMRGRSVGRSVGSGAMHCLLVPSLNAGPAPSTRRAASMAEGSTGGGEWDLVEEYEVYERACGAMGELLLLVSEV